MGLEPTTMNDEACEFPEAGIRMWTEPEVKALLEKARTMLGSETLNQLDGITISQLNQIVNGEGN